MFDDMGSNQIFDKSADFPRANNLVKAKIDFFIDLVNSARTFLHGVAAPGTICMA